MGPEPFSTTPSSAVGGIAFSESPNKAMNEPVNGSGEEAASSSWQNSTVPEDNMDHSSSNSSSGSPHSSTPAGTPPGMRHIVTFEFNLLLVQPIKTTRIYTGTILCQYLL